MIPVTPEQLGAPSTASKDSLVLIVDFGPFLHGKDEERKAVAKQIDEAFRTVGFVYLKNHGVPQKELDQCFEWSAKFFNLPTETKMLAPHPPGGSHHRGYSGLGLEKVTQHVFDTAELQSLRQAPDIKESFESGNETDERQPNIWPPPTALPGFQPFVQSFFHTCTALVHTVLRSLALALSLPDERFLSAAHAASAFQLRLLHYPPAPLAALHAKAATRIGAHSDFGSLTLLFQDGVGGLEVEDPHAPGRFRPAPPVEGAVLVNVGDLMERWSNGRWRSTVHRVGAPPAAGEGADGAAVEGKMTDGEGGEVMCKARYSIPFFSAPDDDALIEALPGCWDESNPKKYEAVTSAEYVTMRMNAIY